MNGGKPVPTNDSSDSGDELGDDVYSGGHVAPSKLKHKSRRSRVILSLGICNFVTLIIGFGGTLVVVTERHDDEDEFLEESMWLAGLGFLLLTSVTSTFFLVKFLLRPLIAINDSVSQLSNFDNVMPRIPKPIENKSIVSKIRAKLGVNLEDDNVKATNRLLAKIRSMKIENRVLKQANHLLSEQMCSMRHEIDNEFYGGLASIAINLQICTWNMGDAGPPSNIRDWLFPDSGAEPDIIVCGVQECRYQRAFRHMQDTILAAIGPLYYRVVGKEIFPNSGIILWVFAKRSHEYAIGDVQTSRENTGMLSVLPNKGAVTAAFQIYGSSLCFVCSHLAAHDHQVVARNENVAEIIAETTLKSYQTQLTTIRQGKYHDPALELTDAFEHVFWFGDLNYRINRPLEETHQKVEEGDLEYLAKYDQLNLERAEDRVYCEFTEGPLNFNPTFKMKQGEVAQYQREPKNRVPSWCDRILWKSYPGLRDNVRQLEYNSVPSLITSDHQPVHGNFELNLNKAFVPVSAQLECRIALYDIQVEATDKQGNQRNDPTDIEFHAKFLEHIVRLRPRKGETAIELLPLFTDPEFLRTSHLTFVIAHDEKWSKKFSSAPARIGRASKRAGTAATQFVKGRHASDMASFGRNLKGRTGQGVISLRPAMDAPYHFSVPILHHGLKVGTFSGTISVTYQNIHVRRRFWELISKAGTKPSQSKGWGKLQALSNAPGTWKGKLHGLDKAALSDSEDESESEGGMPSYPSGDEVSTDERV